jgi:hypothetical protein
MSSCYQKAVDDALYNARASKAMQFRACSCAIDNEAYEIPRKYCVVHGRLVFVWTQEMMMMMMRMGERNGYSR